MTLEFRRPRTLLLPVDFSLAASLAAGCIKLLAGRFSSSTVLLHVLEPVSDPLHMLGESMVERRPRKEIAEDELRQFAKEHLGSINTEIVVEEGEPAEVIARTAERVGADLLVMPTRGRGRFRRFLLGSTTAKVLNDVALPVLTTAHTHDGEPVCLPVEVKRVLCALALDDKSAETLTSAKLVASEYGAQLTVVHVLEDRHDREWALARFREIAGAAEPAIDLQVETGSPVRAITRLARELPADLVIIGRSHPGPLGRLRAQSYEVIRESPVPVLSV